MRATPRRVPQEANDLVAAAMAFMPTLFAQATARDRLNLKVRVSRARAAGAESWPVGARCLWVACVDVVEKRAACIPAGAISAAVDAGWPVLLSDRPLGWLSRRDLGDGEMETC